jgi:hypothetical protein
MTARRDLATVRKSHLLFHLGSKGLVGLGTNYRVDPGNVLLEI